MSRNDSNGTQAGPPQSARKDPVVTRRRFLEGAGAGLLAAGLPVPRFFVLSDRRPRPGNVFVAIFLRGGQDPLNTVVPYRDPDYRRLRPTLALPAPGKGGPEPGAVLPLTKDFGLHPALAPLRPLFAAKRFAPILAVGSPHPTRSHFDSQDFMEYAAPGIRTERRGWLNRYLAATAGRGDEELRALAFQGLLPRSLRGPFPALAAAGRGSGAVLDLFDELYAGGGSEARGGMARRRGRDEVLASGRATIATLRRLEEILASAPPPPKPYPKGPLAGKLEGIARVIRSGAPLEVACADWNGWDHHVKEAGQNGRLEPMLRHLAQSLAAFFEDLGPHAERTLVLTMTEFGRTARENGNYGTDHGHGSLMFALGGPVRGGRIYGRWPGLSDRDLYQGRDLAVTTDFRDVFAEVLTKHLRFKRIPKDFFPDYRPGRGPGFLG